MNIDLFRKLWLFSREEAEGRSSSDMLAEVLHDSTTDEVFVKDSSFSGSSPTPGGQGMF